MYFIGVTTRKSSIMRIFPAWAEIFGLQPAELLGVDVPPHANPAIYRRTVTQIKLDPLSLGATVTTHKVDLLAATRDLFEELDPNAELCQEVSNIAKRDGRLIGFAKDPETSGRTIREMVEPGHWRRTGGHVLCLGAGGTTRAIAAYLLRQPDPAERPDRFIAIGRSVQSLTRLRSVIDGIGGPVEVDYVLNDEPARNDELVSRLPPGSLVVNATGMGKDRPGSPITTEAVFPERGVVWELNYRGELGFLHQAETQAIARSLRVFDGWRYFVHGWIDHVAEVFDVDVDATLFARLAHAADAIRA